MTPKLKELAEQAGYLPDMFGIGHWDTPECQKFAELIVRECAKRVDYWEARQGEHTEDLLKHFGVGK
jgi:hypothetical protein